MAVAHSPERDYLSDLIKAASSFGLESSTVVDWPDCTLLIFRISHQGRSLEPSEIQEISDAFKLILT
jgi:hypothetical protein